MADQNIAYESCDSRSFTVWGGCDSAERQMIRFGDAREIGYEVDFPIVCIEIAPVNPSFSEALGHRDYLGALMNLGIERDVIGDVFFNGKKACVFACERMADYITENLFRVRRTSVNAKRIEELPEDMEPKLEEINIITASARIDILAAKVFNLSRSKVKAAFGRQEIFLNGRTCTNPSAEPKEGDIVSFRHHGRFVYCGVEGSTKKGNLAVRIKRSRAR